MKNLTISNTETIFLAELNKDLGYVKNPIQKLTDVSANGWFDISEKMRDIHLSSLARVVALSIMKGEDPVKTLEDHKQLLSI